MPSVPRAYRPSVWKRFSTVAFKTTVLASVAVGVGITGYIVAVLGKHFLFDYSAYKQQRKEYAKAILEKEQRERELGLRD